MDDKSVEPREIININPADHCCTAGLVILPNFIGFEQGMTNFEGLTLEEDITEDSLEN